MRVLHVVTHMNRGGLETMLMNYYRHMDREQVQFDFLTHRDYNGDYGCEIKELGGYIFHLPKLNPFSLKYRYALHTFFREHPEYKVVHAHQDCLSSVILKEAEYCGVPVRIGHSHNSSQDKNFKYLIKLYYRNSIPRYATHLFACSREAGNWMFRGADFSVLNNAIDAKQYAFSERIRQTIRDELGVSEDEILFGHVGRLSPQKNHEYLLEVFRMISMKAPSKLLLVGDGELRSEIENQARQLGIRGRVIFTGVRSDVADLLQAMDVFIFPSLYEGLGIVAVEAQAAGLPCLISERVPLECKVTDLVEQLPLSDGAERWANAAIRMAKTERKDTFEQIKAAGYDIHESAKKLQKFYLNAL